MWDNQGDAQMRTAGSIVRWKGDPVYIKEVYINDNRKVAARMVNLRTGKQHRSILASKDWDWTPVPTGFVNVRSRTFYVSRVPIRKWKQGLHRDNVKIVPQNPGGRDIIRTAEFAACVRRDYPSFEECMTRLDDKIAVSWAFHPEWAVERDPSGLTWLLHRSRKVGWLQDDEAKLGEEYGYLKESYAEARA